MKVGNTTLSEISQTQKDKHCMISLDATSRTGEVTETEGRLAATPG